MAPRNNLPSVDSDHKSLISFYINLPFLRMMAIVAPILFVVGVGLLGDRVLEPSLPDVWAHVVATVIVAAGVLVFARSVFALLERAYQRLEEQNEELRALTDTETRRVEEWKALFELGREVTASPDLQGLLNSVVSRAKRLLDADVALLMLLSPDGSHLQMAAHAGLRTADMRALRMRREHGLQGLVLETGKPVIVEDYLADPRLRDRPAALVRAEGLVSQIAVPFSGKGKLLGTLSVGNRQRTALDVRQAELLEAFATWAAVVVETRKLYEQLQSLALLEERERIGMDLHDGAIQSIYAVVLRLEDCAERLSEHPEEVPAGLEKAMDDLNKVIQDIRSYIFDLRPEVLQGDLERAMEDLVQGVRVNALIDAELAVEGDLNSAVTEDQAVSLFRIAQEALSNVSRHAQASSLQVKLTALPQSVRLEITDDGIGFDPQADRPEDKRGLRNINERAHMLGAKLSVESAPGSGTRVSVELPVGSVRQ